MSPSRQRIVTFSVERATIEPGDHRLPNIGCQYPTLGYLVQIAISKQIIARLGECYRNRPALSILLEDLTVENGINHNKM